MTGSAIGTTVFMAVILIGGLLFCFSRIGKGGGAWEDWCGGFKTSSLEVKKIPWSIFFKVERFLLVAGLRLGNCPFFVFLPPFFVKVYKQGHEAF